MKRKRIFLLLASGLLLISHNLLSQKYQQEPPNLESRFLEFIKDNRVENPKSEPYIPLLDTAKIWNEAMRIEFGYIATTTRHTGSATDTLIYNDTTYSILFNDIFVAMALREDTTERKVYSRDYYYTGWGQEQLLYDFGIEVGDTMPNSTSVLDSIVQTNFFGLIRNVFFFHGLSDPENIPYYKYWIEGIGSLAGLLRPNFVPGLYDTGQSELSCVFHSNEQVYQSYWASVYGCNFEYFDTDPPSLQEAWCTPDTIENAEVANVFIRATDNITGFTHAYIELQSPDNRLYVYTNFTTVEEGLKKLEIDWLQSPKRFWNAVGTWWVSVILISDAVGNETFYTYNESTSPAKFYVRSIIGLENEMSTSVTLFPNPANNTITLELNENILPRTHYTIYDPSGKALKNGPIEVNLTEISLENLQQGIYILKVTAGNQTTYFSKFIKI